VYLFANAMRSGKSPVMSAEQCKRHGYSIVIYLPPS
jgi:2-methylisocitrate lyase-like PEP mutase family enzyme